MEFFHVKFKPHNNDEPVPGHQVFLTVPTEQRTIAVHDGIAHVSQETYDWLKDQGHKVTKVGDATVEKVHAEAEAHAHTTANPPAQLPEGVERHVVDMGHATATVTEPTKPVQSGPAVQAAQAGASEKSTDRSGQQPGPSVHTTKPAHSTHGSGHRSGGRR